MGARSRRCWHASKESRNEPLVAVMPRCQRRPTTEQERRPTTEQVATAPAFANRRIIDGSSLAGVTHEEVRPTPLRAQMVPKHVRYQATLLPGDQPHDRGTAEARRSRVTPAADRASHTQTPGGHWQADRPSGVPMPARLAGPTCGLRRIRGSADGSNRRPALHPHPTHPPEDRLRSCTLAAAGRTPATWTAAA